MKIDAHFFGLDRTGGVVVLFRYLEALRDAGNRVAITTLGTPDDPRFLPVPEGVEVRFGGLRGKGYRSLMHASRGYLGYPERELHRLTATAPAADLRIATYTFTVGSTLAAGGPVLHHVQHYEALLETTARRKKLIDHYLREDVYRTANCTWVAQRIADVGGDVRGIIAPAIDHDVFHPTGRDAAAGDRPAPLRIITLGKAVEWKGLVDVAAASGIVARDTGGVVLVTYGRDKPKAPAGVVVEHHGLVDCARLAELYRSADVCITGSWYESFPLPPLEAMACGTAVVCTRLGTEDYANHEENCLVVPARDPEAIAAAVNRLRLDAPLRASLVAGGLVTAQRFRWEDAEKAFVAHAVTAAGLQTAPTEGAAACT